MLRNIFLPLIVVLLSFPGVLQSSLTSYPDFLQPGTVYREFTKELHKDNNWRVTDPQAPHEGAGEFLPNKVMELEVDSLVNVTHASIMISHWLGHPGTTGQIFFFNDSPRYVIPLNPNYPAAHRDHFMNMDLKFFDLPVEYLKAGSNQFRGSFLEEEQGKHWWGQWGWYLFMLRTFLDPTSADAEVEFLGLENQDTIGDNPVLKIKADSTNGIDRIDVFARYYGYDENGDYLFNDWHGFFHNTDLPEGHVGTLEVQPGSSGNKVWELKWNTEWIPDQQPGAVALVARVRDLKGVWHVGRAVTGLTLQRKDRSVRMVVSARLPTNMIRDGRREFIPFKKGWTRPMAEGTRALLKIRTWNGANNERGYTPFILNKGAVNSQLAGRDHYYKLDEIRIDPTRLEDGNNIMEVFSETHHHGCEILIPGPAILVEYMIP